MDKYLHEFKGKTFMENTIDFGTSWKFQRINLISWSFDSFFKVHWKLLYHPKWKGGEEREKKNHKQNSEQFKHINYELLFQYYALVLPTQKYLAIAKSICTTNSAKLPTHRIPTYTSPCIPAVLQYSLIAWCESSAAKFRRDGEGTSFPHAKRQAQEPVLTCWCVSTTSSSLLGSALTSAAGAFRKSHKRIPSVMEKSKVMSLCFSNQNI